MNKVDIKGWGKFHIEDLFEVVKGTRLTKQDMKEGSINYVGATAFNNGITNHIGNDEHIHPAGTLTVAYNGSIGQTFYQVEPFWATDDVNVLYPRFKMSKHIALFIAPIIRSIGRNYEYTDKWQLNDMKKSSIFLPVDEDNHPDFVYMESYMSEIETKAVNIIDELLDVANYNGKHGHIDYSSWKEFLVGDYFDATNTGNILSRDVNDGSGSTPYVTASGENNGIVAHIDAGDYDLIKGNCILIGGKTFTLTYQKEDFLSNDSHNFEVHLKNNYGSENVYLFLITVFRQSFSSKYSWGDAVTKSKFLAQRIYLPTDNNGNPDWAYMESYIDNIHKRNRAYISAYQSVL